MLEEYEKGKENEVASYLPKPAVIIGLAECFDMIRISTQIGGLSKGSLPDKDRLASSQVTLKCT